MSWWFGRKSSPDVARPFVPAWLRAGEEEGFVRSGDGLAVYVRSTGEIAVCSAGSWDIGTLRGARVEVGGEQVVGPQGAAISAPAGGATSDAEARSTIGQILTAMRGHGLIAM